MTRRRLALLLLLAAAAACEGPRDPGARSVHVLDPANLASLGESWWLGDAIAWERSASYDLDGGTGGVLTTLWLARLDGSAPVAIDSGISSWWALREPSTGNARWLVTYKRGTGTETSNGEATLTPVSGGDPVKLERFVEAQLGERCEAVLGQESGPNRLWRGPDCDAMQPVASPLGVGRIVDMQSDRTLVAATAGTVEAGTGIHSIDLDGVTTEVVPAVLGDHDEVPGQAPVGAIVSTSIYAPGFRRLCPEGRCFLLYNRFAADAGGELASFLMPEDTRREIALPRHARWISAPGTLDPRFAIWGEGLNDPVQPEVRNGYRFVLWDLGSGRIKSCDVATSNLFQAGHSEGAAALLYSGAQQNPLGVTVESLGDAPCFSIEKPVLSGERQPVFSPAGSRMAFEVARTELWLADGAGQNQRRMLSGRWLDRIEFAGNEDELIVASSDFDDDVALGLLDVGTAEPSERSLVTRVFGPWRRIGRQILVGAARDPDRKTGELRLYDLDRHGHQLIDRDVASYIAVDQAVAYWVEGTGSRDGLWVRRLP